MSNGELGSVLLGTDDRLTAVAAVKAMLRIDQDNDDALIASLVESALGMAEQFLGQVLIARSVQSILPAGSGWQRLVGAPVRAITQVEGLAPDGTATLLPVDRYAIDIDARGDGWVRPIKSNGVPHIRVTGIAGRADSWADLPAPVRQGAVLLAGYLFSERDTTRPPPAAITALWRPFRGLALAPAVHA